MRQWARALALAMAAAGVGQVVSAQRIDGLVADSIVEQAIRERLQKAKGKLTEADLARVTELDLAFTQITDKGLKEVSKLPQLQRLYLNGTPITDASLKALAGLPQLTALNLWRTKITDAGLMELAKFPRLRSCHREGAHGMALDTDGDARVITRIAFR